MRTTISALVTLGLALAGCGDNIVPGLVIETRVARMRSSVPLSASSMSAPPAYTTCSAKPCSTTDPRPTRRPRTKGCDVTVPFEWELDPSGTLIVFEESMEDGQPTHVVEIPLSFE